MALHRRIVETCELPLIAHDCDLCCGFMKEAHKYLTRTPIEQDDRQRNRIIRTWTETLWYICCKCQVLIQNRMRSELYERAADGHDDPKTVAKIVAGFLQGNPQEVDVQSPHVRTGV